jgi:hypothetical protein
MTLCEDLAVLQKSPDPSLTVYLQGTAEAFAKSLRDQGMRIEAESERSLRVFGPEEQTSPAVWKTARETGITVRSIVPSRTSLDEVFLKAVQETSHADS